MERGEGWGAAVGLGVGWGAMRAWVVRAAVREAREGMVEREGMEAVAEITVGREERAAMAEMEAQVAVGWLGSWEGEGEAVRGAGMARKAAEEGKEGRGEAKVAGAAQGEGMVGLGGMAGEMAESVAAVGQCSSRSPE